VALLIIAVVFGYLIGVLLRLFRPAFPDRLSAAWVRAFHRSSLRGEGRLECLAPEGFPYFDWIGEDCERYLPPGVVNFYKETWALKKHKGPGSPFFSFCKVIVTSEDERAAGEIYAAEALTRYMSGMFYALVFASLLILVIVVLQYVVLGQIMVGLIIVLAMYVFAVGVILSRFRFIRIKEVETVFAAAFKNRSLFQETVETADIGTGADRSDTVDCGS
jgi:hypothetical protein